MHLKEQFLYRPFIDLTASNIGINKWTWQTISEENETKAKEIMSKNRFDVLPILSEDGNISKYYSTRVLNDYENLNLTTISQSDTVYYRISFCDLIRKFSNEGRHYYFLTDYHTIVGLVSFVNLNCQAVCNYIFQVIADIERSLSCFLKEHISSEEIVAEYKKSTDTHLTDVIKAYENSIKEGSDNSIFEYMYLQTIGITINKFHSKLPSKAKKLLSFYKKFSPSGTYGILRNKVMHPVRPILSGSKSIGQINELLHDYSIIKEVLT